MPARSVPPPSFSRRRLLKSGLLGTAVLTLGGLGLSLQKTALVAPTPTGLLLFSEQEFAVLTAIAERLCPGKEPHLPSARELGVAKAIDAMLANAAAEDRDALKIALRVFESPLSGAIFAERVAPFTQLEPAEQDRVLHAWRNSTVAFRRTLFTSLSGLVQSVYWSNPETWSSAGYPGPLDAAALRKTYAENLVDLNGLRASTTDLKGS